MPDPVFDRTRQAALKAAREAIDLRVDAIVLNSLVQQQEFLNEELAMLRKAPPIPARDEAIAVAEKRLAEVESKIEELRHKLKWKRTR